MANVTRRNSSARRAVAGRGGRLQGERSNRAPAGAQAKELTFLTVASFVPERNKELKRQFLGVGAKNK
jgi:hypothetical protein